MLKTSILCALGGMILLLAGSFGNFQRTQNLESTQDKPCLFVQPNALNVREMPNLESKVIHKLQRNSKICEYFDTQNGYLQTKMGWVAIKYLHLEPLKQSPAPALSQNKALQMRDSKLYLASTSVNSESHSNKPQNKSKFKLTSTTKDSIPALSYPSEQDFVQTPIQSPIIQARAEMENQNYTRAKNLALRANLANPKNLESWEIFAKSLYLEGNPQEAISILQNFLQQNYDENLANLLKSMQQGHKI
ncbi:hypothetical protein [Helicobacter sp.]|uniref:hypothetical protein n=1 Tax=Helicobacter sp. TaxID=218 RepID=UPI00198A7ABB|nr:hypothetical protein [Helicobacter sp.]MBD5165970.1 hypothetical protein [Helicobacter sp.]